MEQGVQLKYMILEATLLTTALCRIFWGHRGRQATQLRAEREGEKEELLEFSLSSVLVISNTPPPPLHTVKPQSFSIIIAPGCGGSLGSFVGSGLGSVVWL